MTALADLARPAQHGAVAEALLPWLPRQRWFAGKARSIVGVSLHDEILLEGDDVVVMDTLVDVEFDDGHRERYQVPLAAADACGAQAIPLGTVAGVDLVDATTDPGAARLLAGLTCDQTTRLTGLGGRVHGFPPEAGSATLDLQQAEVLRGEQSNTSVVFGQTAIVKLFRRLEPGENPEVEITRALTRQGFPNAPRQLGALLLDDANGNSTGLAVLAAFVAGGRDAWRLATDEVARLVESPVACAMADSWLLERLGALGVAVADMHATLRDALGSRPATPGDAKRWLFDMRAQVDRVLATAVARAAKTSAAVLRRRDELLERLTALSSGNSDGEADGDDNGPLTRIHGDLHLGQVLLDRQDRWQLLDFEGEPARSLVERRALHAPLRDVAGMLRSFDYAAAAGYGGDLATVGEAAAAWRDDARRRFLDGYLATAADHGLLPSDPEVVAAQLDAFELDKAVYELGYELGNRPAWVGIPIGGITRVLDRRSSGGTELVDRRPSGGTDPLDHRLPNG
ncbi:hypothetical protein BH24ACT14_BH24ACT14_23810 [soil metagenome]